MNYNKTRGDYMSIKNRTSHLMLMLPADLIEEIEAYKEENRIRSKNETIRTLIQKGLKESVE